MEEARERGKAAQKEATTVLLRLTSTRQENSDKEEMGLKTGSCYVFLTMQVWPSLKPKVWLSPSVGGVLLVYCCITNYCKQVPHTFCGLRE